jgi:NAD(P)H dehydrogenase (quinone)
MGSYLFVPITLILNLAQKEKNMYAITGITGQVGGAVAQALLNTGEAVRAVVRNEEKGQHWTALGCEVAIADIMDSKALAKAFQGTKGGFLMTPPNYDPEPGFPQTHEIVRSILAALQESKLEKLVFLSTVGAHVKETNLLNNAGIIEEALRKTGISIGLLRAAWFMENASWDKVAASTGVIPSFLQPLDHPIPMVATQDIGNMAATMLREDWTGTRVLELEGPERYSAEDIAAAFTRALGHEVRMEALPHDAWESLFRSQGMNYPMPRIRMIDGFNEGWIDFERNGKHIMATTSLDEVIANLVKN